MAANAAGGGTVAVPAGTYVTGAIYLKSNVNLRLDGTTLRFSGTASRFPTVLTRYEGIECMNRSPMIYAFGETNSALTGSGTLDAGPVRRGIRGLSGLSSRTSWPGVCAADAAGSAGVRP